MWPNKDGPKAHLLQHPGGWTPAPQRREVSLLRQTVCCVGQTRRPGKHVVVTCRRGSNDREQATPAFPSFGLRACVVGALCSAAEMGGERSARNLAPPRRTLATLLATRLEVDAVTPRHPARPRGRSIGRPGLRPPRQRPGESTRRPGRPAALASAEAPIRIGTDTATGAARRRAPPPLPCDPHATTAVRAYIGRALVWLLPTRGLCLR